MKVTVYAELAEDVRKKLNRWRRRPLDMAFRSRTLKAMRFRQLFV